MYMQANQRQSHASKPMFQSVMEFLLSKITSQHGKRILFITSLYFQVVRIERMKAEIITKLNEVMGLTSNEDALRFPAKIRGVVWSNTDLTAALSEEVLDKDISEDRAREISEHVVDIAPKWVRYGRRADMVTDVMTLIQSGRQLAAAA